MFAASNSQIVVPVWYSEYVCRTIDMYLVEVYVVQKINANHLYK